MFVRSLLGEQYIIVSQIIALAMVFSCVLRKLDDDDEREELAEANAHPEKDEETIAKEEDPVLMLGEPPKSNQTKNIYLPILIITSVFVKLNQNIPSSGMVNEFIHLMISAVILKEVNCVKSVRSGESSYVPDRLRAIRIPDSPNSDELEKMRKQRRYEKEMWGIVREVRTKPIIPAIYVPTDLILKRTSQPSICKSLCVVLYFIIS